MSVGIMNKFKAQWLLLIQRHATLLFGWCANNSSCISLTASSGWRTWGPHWFLMTLLLKKILTEHMWQAMFGQWSKWSFSCRGIAWTGVDNIQHTGWLRAVWHRWVWRGSHCVARASILPIVGRNESPKRRQFAATDSVCGRPCCVVHVP